MKKIILFFTFLTYSIGFGQDLFSYDLQGLKPNFIVKEVDEMSQADLFRRSLNWIKETYKNPDIVIKMTIDFEKIRFEGFQSNVVCMRGLGDLHCYNVIYTIEVEFKDGKYRFIPLSLNYGVNKYSINLQDGSDLYNKKSELRKVYNTVPESVAGLFNDLNINLHNYLLKKGNQVDDW